MLVNFLESYGSILRRIALAEAILPIATDSSVAWSVCLSSSHSCTLFKAFDRYTCGIE